jgi:hypothetical protein
MAFWIIPTEDAAERGAFFESVDLEGETYQFEFQYNSREGFWYFNLLDVDGNQLRSGIKIVVNWPLLIRDRSLSAPAGDLMCLDTRSQPQDPGLDSLGVDGVMAYNEAES